MATVAKDFLVRNGVTAGTLVKGLTLQSTVATGTAPMVVASTTLVTNLNAQYLNGIASSGFAVSTLPLSQFAATTSLELKGVISDETGSGALVFATTPTLVTPVLGAATATSINGLTITSSTGTLTITNGKTLSASNTLTFTGTDGSSVAFGTGGTVVYTGGNLSQFASTTSAQLAGVISDEVGTDKLVFNTSPTFVTSVITSSASFDAFNTNATAVNAFGAATTLNLGAGTGTTTVNNNLVVGGNLTVNGTVSTINSTTVTVDDKNIELGSTASPTDVTADGGGITLRGTTDKTFNWVDATDSWTSSESIDLATGKVLKIAGTQVLSAAQYTGNAATATTAAAWTTSRTVTFATGDVTGSFSLSGSADVSNVVLTIAANSVVLGTDTTGNYVSDVTGTTNQITATPTGTEPRTIVLSTPQDIHTAATPQFATVNLGTTADITSDTVTVTANSTPTTLDSFTVATFTSAEYLVQAKQGTKMTTTHLLVQWDGTDANIAEWGYIDGLSGAANVTFTATHSAGTMTVSASSTDAATTNVVIKASTTYIAA